MTQPILDNQTFAIGAIQEPLSLDTSSLLKRADPSLYFALDFFTWIIRNYPGPGFLLAAMTGAGLKDTKGQPVQNAVEQAYPDDPVPYLGGTYLRFPCLAMYRKGSKYKRHSAGYYDDRCAFDLLYILPPMNAGQAEGILPILNAIEKAIRQKTIQSFDPNYAPPGGVAGQSPWGLSFAAVEEIGFEEGVRGKLPDANMVFPFLQMSGFVIERDMPLPAQNKFAGGDVTTSLVASDGTVLSPFVQASTFGPPTLTGISPNSAPVAGGTGLTLTGTFFQGGTAVFIGALPATNVVVASNGLSLTCVSPQAQGPGAVNVTVKVPQQPTVSLAQAFAFV